MTKLEQYYNSFKEDHRLTTRHGIVEMTITMDFIQKELKLLQKTPQDIKIVDIGAGTGRYSVALAELGYDVTAVELVPHNLEILRSKKKNIKTWKGDARNLHFLQDDCFDLALVFGPLYHLHSDDDKVAVLKEAKRICKAGATIMTAYLMNEYSVLTYCFKQKNIASVIQASKLTKDFHTICDEDDLYDYVRLEDIERYNKLTGGLARKTIFAPDGAADYMRRELNALTDEEFEYFLHYQRAICERQDLLGASSHTVDVLCNQKSSI